MLQTEPQASLGRDGEAGTRQMYFILYPKELEDEVIQALESAGVPGYTEMPKMVGRGRHIRHFDNPVWPGATGAVFTRQPARVIAPVPGADYRSGRR